MTENTQSIETNRFVPADEPEAWQEQLHAMETALNELHHALTGPPVRGADPPTVKHACDALAALRETLIGDATLANQVHVNLLERLRVAEAERDELRVQLTSLLRAAQEALEWRLQTDHRDAVNQRPGRVTRRVSDDVNRTSDVDPPAEPGAPVAEKLTVNLIEPASRALIRAAERTGLSRTDTVNRALQVYDLVTFMEESGVYVRNSTTGEFERLTLR